MSAEQSDAWRAAVDQRMEGFEGRKAARRVDARRRLNEEIRSNIAGVVKPASMAASVTPYDLGLGDVGYAAGELIDPEGTYGDAALAAAGGILTGGIGSGAIMTKAAKEARALEKAGVPGVVRRNPGAVAKAPMQPNVMGGPPRRAPVGPDAPVINPTRRGAVIRENPNVPMRGRKPDFEDTTPTNISTVHEIMDTLYEAKNRAARNAKAYVDSMRTPPQIDPSLITKQSTRSLIPPELAIGVGGAAAIGALGKERLREQQEAGRLYGQSDFGQALQAAAEADIGIGAYGTPGYLERRMEAFLGFLMRSLCLIGTLPVGPQTCLLSTMTQTRHTVQVLVIFK